MTLLHDEGSGAQDVDLPFAFSMEIRKSLGTESVHGARARLIEGIAASEDLDQQNEVLLLDGMDFSPFTKSGWINWNHQEGPEFLLGRPLEACIKRFEGGKRGFYVKGELLPEHPKADATWSLLEAMEKSGWRDRFLGWSVQGGVTQRQGHRLTKSVVRHVALTHEPVNAVTFAEMCKSFAKALSIGTQIVPNPLAGPDWPPPPQPGIVYPTTFAPPTTNAAALAVPPLTSVLWGDCTSPTASCYDMATGQFHSPSAALEHLVICKGHSIDESKDFLLRLIKSGLTR